MPARKPLELEVVNRLDEDAFVVALAGVFEHSPWVARAAARSRPFASWADAHGAFAEAVGGAGAEEQLALIRVHPELAGREAVAGELTAESAGEQAAAGLDRLSADDLRRLADLNRAYRERFGFPLVICVRRLGKDSILAIGECRLGRTRAAEIRASLHEIVEIARLRLENLVSD